MVSKRVGRALLRTPVPKIRLNRSAPFDANLDYDGGTDSHFPEPTALRIQGPLDPIQRRCSEVYGDRADAYEEPAAALIS